MTFLSLYLVYLVVVLIYVFSSLFLNNFNKLVTGKGTPLAWIPICNVYLLGKLTINKLVGWILVIFIVSTGSFTLTINGVSKVFTLFPQDVSIVLNRIYSIFVLGLFIYAIVKYNSLKKG